jgi:hypothetical protein
MQTITTKGATALLYTDEFRSNGCSDVWCLQNESHTVELEALNAEIESATTLMNIFIDSDLIPDEVMAGLIDRLNIDGVLDVPISPLD